MDGRWKREKFSYMISGSSSSGKIRRLNPSSEEEAKWIFLCWESVDKESVDKGMRTAIRWYRINPYEDDQGSHQVITPVSDGYPDTHTSCAACVGSSIIYMFGGRGRPSEKKFIDPPERRVIPPREQYTNEILLYDTTQLPMLWQKHSLKMLSNRSAPCVVPIDKRIFIFGSEFHHDRPRKEFHCIPEPWAEVFDTQSVSVSALQNPPDILIYNTSGVSSNVVFDNGNKILLAAPASETLNYYRFSPSYQSPSPSMREDILIFIYDVVNDSWLIDDHLLLSPPPRLILPIVSPRNAVLGDIIYTFAFGKVHAYDLNKQQWFQSHVEGLLDQVQVYEYGYPFGFIHNLGNGLLFVVFCTFDDGRFWINCASFSPIFLDSDLDGDGGEPTIRAAVESSARYIIHDQYYPTLLDSLPL